MRVLETVMSSWPMPEMQKQIDAVREAFSADVRKPFTLRPSFPYGSPATKASSASPPSLATGGGSYGSGLVRTASAEQQMAAAHNNSRVGAYGANPISPPASTGRSDVKVEISVGQPPIVVMGAANASQGPSMHIPATLSLAETQGWNPNRIFE